MSFNLYIPSFPGSSARRRTSCTLVPQLRCESVVQSRLLFFARTHPETATPRRDRACETFTNGSGATSHSARVWRTLHFSFASGLPVCTSTKMPIAGSSSGRRMWSLSTSGCGFQDARLAWSLLSSAACHWTATAHVDAELAQS